MSDRIRGINLLMPKGTNSTMFTDCCNTAICDDQLKCPSCGQLVIGYDAETDYERGRIRWKFATCLWKKRRINHD